MKKILIAMSLFMMVGVAANAQACTKGEKAKCCAKKGATSADASAVAPATRVASAMTEADIAAEGDVNISSRVCEVSGTKSYYMKSVCETTGNVSWEKADYCTKSKSFTKVASASMERDVDGTTTATEAAPAAKTKACSKGAASSCCSKKKVG